MAVLVVPGAYLVTINADSGGQRVANVIGVSGIAGQAANIAILVATAWGQTNGPRNLHALSYTMRDVTVMDLSSATGEVYIHPTSGTGGQTGALATNASCAIISYSSGSRSRSTRGRMYHGPLTETQMAADGRFLASTIETSLTNAYLQFKAALELGGYSWVVISRKNSSFVPIVAPKAQALTGTQRRRLR